MTSLHDFVCLCLVYSVVFIVFLICFFFVVILGPPSVTSTDPLFPDTEPFRSKSRWCHSAGRYTAHPRVSAGTPVPGRCTMIPVAEASARPPDVQRAQGCIGLRDSHI